MFIAPRSSRCPRVPLLRARRARPRAARGPRRAHGGLPRLRQPRPQPAERAARRRAAAEHRPPPRQHALRDGQPRRGGRLLHRRDRLGPDAGLGVAPTPAIAEALYIGLVTDTGRFTYENTGPRAHRDGRRADRRGRRRARRLPADLRGHAARASSSCSRARSRSVQRYDEGELTHRRAQRRGLPRDRRGGELLRGDHRPAARRAGHEGRGARPRALRRRARGPAQGLAARDRRRRRRVGDRPRQGGGGHRRAAGFSTALDARGARRVPARARSPRSCTRADGRAATRSPEPRRRTARRRDRRWTASC